MSNWDFFDLLNQHLVGFLFVLIGSLGLYAFLYRKWFVSILDPFFWAAVMSSCGFAVVIFMYVEGTMQTKYLFSYLVTQFTFLFSALFFNRLGFHSLFRKPFHIQHQHSIVQLVHLICMVGVVCIQLYVYRSEGIPMFMESRLGAGKGGTGAGLLYRFLSIWGIIAFMLSLYTINLRKKTLIFYLSCGFIIFYILTLFLGGSKAALLTVANLLFIYAILFSTPSYNLLAQLKKHEKTIILLSVAAGMGVILVASHGSGNNLLLSFASLTTRFVFSGDVYWYLYPGGYIELLDSSRPLASLFSDFLGMTRLAHWDQLPEHMGITTYLFHHSSDTIIGPNARHNVFGYVMFGMYGSILFSFFLGAITGTVRNIFYQASETHVLIKVFIAVLYQKVWLLETDITLALMEFDSLIVTSFTLIILVMTIIGLNALLNKKKFRHVKCSRSIL